MDLTLTNCFVSLSNAELSNIDGGAFTWSDAAKVAGVVAGVAAIGVGVAMLPAVGIIAATSAAGYYTVAGLAATSAVLLNL